MISRPRTIAFDVVETLFDLEAVRGHFRRQGFEEGSLELWFATALRDMFALTATGMYVPMAKILESAIDELCAVEDKAIESGERQKIVEAMGSLEPRPDVEPALTALKGAGFRMIALSNGSMANTERLLQKADISSAFEMVISTDEIGRFKPHADVYLHAARTLGLQPGEVMLIAAHSWDVNGAKSAGLKGAYVDRGKPFPVTMHEPDLVGTSLTDLASTLSKL